MTVELMEKIISALEGLKTSLFGIEVTLAAIGFTLAIGIGVLAVIAVRMGDRND